MTLALLILVLSVAYANGANDVSKSVATLVGSGLATYRRALMWGTMWTLAGAAGAIVLSSGLLRTFSEGLLQTQPAEPNRVLLAVSIGVFGWVMIASRLGLPVSTTHAITGSIVGAAVAMRGLLGVRWDPLLWTVLLPLGLSPVLSASIAYALRAFTARYLSAASGYCVCIEQRNVELVSVAGVGAASSQNLSLHGSIVMDANESCAAPTVSFRLRLTDGFHWLTSAALSFARGMNDNPKIVAIGGGVAGVVGFGSLALFMTSAAAMAAGSYFYGKRVTNTLAKKLTPIEPLDGLLSSFVSSGLVITASLTSLPVSTTHVAMGAIVGVGLKNRESIRWRTVRAAVLAWVITLPVTALLAAAAWLAIGIGR